MTKHELSILIPAYNCDCRQLAADLCRQADAISGLTYEVIVADDGSTDRQAADGCRQVASPHYRFIDRGFNSGRAAIRNFLAREARYQRLVFVDSDLTVVSPHFLERYLDCPQQVVYGGYVVGTGAPRNLRYRYERACEQQHRPAERAKRPYQHFHTGNFMTTRSLMLAYPLDERFRAYGYEDVLYGKVLRQAGVAIAHIDNPMGFCTFEDNPHFVSKTEEGLRTLHQFQSELRGYSRLLTLAGNIHLRSVRWLIRLWHALAGPLERRLLCGAHPSLTVFKLYRLGYFLSLK